MEVREDKEIVGWSLGQKWFPSTQGMRVSSRERRFSKTKGKYMRVGVEVGRIEGGGGFTSVSSMGKVGTSTGPKGQEVGSAGCLRELLGE